MALYRVEKLPLIQVRVVSLPPRASPGLGVVDKSTSLAHRTKIPTRAPTRVDPSRPFLVLRVSCADASDELIRVHFQARYPHIRHGEASWWYEEVSGELWHAQQRDR